MKIQSRMKSKTTRTVTEAAVIFGAFVWVIVTGWLFLFSPVTEPPLPPPQVARFLMDIRMLNLSGWLLAQIPLWCLWLDYKRYGVLPAPAGWLRRYGFIAAVSLCVAFRIYSQRNYPAVMAEGGSLSYLLLWTILGLLCAFRNRSER